MAIRTATAAAIDADIAQLKTDVLAHIALQQSYGDAPAVLFWQWLVATMETWHPNLAVAIRTSNMFGSSAGATGATLSQIDGYA